MDAAGVERATVLGHSEGGPAAIYFSVTRPSRTRELVLFGSFPRGIPLLDGPITIEEVRRLAAEAGLAEDEVIDEAQLERLQRFHRHVMNDWGEGKALRELVPHQGDEAQLGLMERLCASPGMARATLASGARLDVTGLLPSIAVPTLIVHAKDDLVPIQGSRIMARRIPGARLLEVEGIDHAPWFSSPDEVVGEIEEFVTGSRRAREPDRVLSTVLFTDIVGSTERAAELGDARWRTVLERHDELTRRYIAEFGGTAVKAMGDGFLATFGGPAAAVRCVQALQGALARESIAIRAGIHTGEIERIDEDVAGLAVHIAARVCESADPGEIRVRTVEDLVVGSGLTFEPRGRHVLKGVPGEWQLLAVATTPVGASEEEKLARIDLGDRRSLQRPMDRVAAAMARRTPTAIRTLIRLDPRYRRSVRRAGGLAPSARSGHPGSSRAAKP